MNAIASVVTLSALMIKSPSFSRSSSSNTTTNLPAGTTTNTHQAASAATLATSTPSRCSSNAAAESPTSKTAWMRKNDVQNAAKPAPHNQHTVMQAMRISSYHLTADKSYNFNRRDLCPCGDVQPFNGHASFRLQQHIQLLQACSYLNKGSASRVGVLGTKAI